MVPHWTMQSRGEAKTQDYVSVCGLVLNIISYMKIQLRRISLKHTEFGNFIQMFKMWHCGITSRLVIPQFTWKSHMQIDNLLLKWIVGDCVQLYSFNNNSGGRMLEVLDRFTLVARMWKLPFLLQSANKICRLLHNLLVQPLWQVFAYPTDSPTVTKVGTVLQSTKFGSILCKSEFRYYGKYGI